MERISAEGPEEVRVLEDIDALEAQDFYARLGVSRSATDEEIKKAFRSLSKKFHPDSVHSDEEMRENYTEVQKRLGEAYNTLSDPSQRVRYDARQAGPEPEPAPQPSYQPKPWEPRREKTIKEELEEEQRRREAMDPDMRFRIYVSDLGKLFQDLETGKSERRLEYIEGDILGAQKTFRSLGISDSEFLKGIKDPLLSYFKRLVRIGNKTRETQLTYMLARLGIEPYEIDIARTTATHGYNPFM